MVYSRSWFLIAVHLASKMEVPGIDLVAHFNNLHQVRRGAYNGVKGRILCPYLIHIELVSSA